MSAALDFLLALSPPGDAARLALADHHGLAPQLHLRRGDQSARLEYQKQARRNLCLIAETAAVTGLLRRAGVPSLVFKGPLLAHWLHGDSALRQSGDIDILVHPDHAPEAIRVLQEARYRLQSSLDWASPQTMVRWNSELPFRAPSAIDVDLHWRISPAHSPFRIALPLPFENPMTMQAAGREFQFPDPECLLLLLVIHGTRHLWERLVWIDDIAALSRQTLDWRRVKDLACCNGLDRAVRAALVLAREIAGGVAPFPIELDPREQAAVDMVYRRLRQGIAPEPRTLDLVRFQWLLAPTRQEMLRHISGLVVTPTEHDWRIARLRPPLSAFYYPLRAGRLALTYARNLSGAI